MSSPSPELIAFMNWAETLPEESLPKAWTIIATRHDGTVSSIAKSAAESDYLTYEDAQRGVIEVLKWAKSAEIKETVNLVALQKMYDEQ